MYPGVEEGEEAEEEEGEGVGVVDGGGASFVGEVDPPILQGEATGLEGLVPLPAHTQPPNHHHHSHQLEKVG